jgi:ATP-binding cassette subfamily F protein uup
VTSSLYFAGQGKVVDIAGDYEDVLAYQKRQQNTIKAVETVQKSVKPVEEKPVELSSTSSKKLSYKEKRELELLPALIETLDAELSALQQQVNDPDFFRQNADYTQKALNQLHEAESKLAHAYERWEQLEALNQQ